jgi:hypothetical protein
MAVIQIWSTCACNNKPLRLGKSYSCHCVQNYALCRKPEGIFKHIGVKTWTQTLRTMVLKSQKNKKMIRNSWNLAWCHDMVPRCHSKKNWHVWRKFWYTPLTNQSISREDSWFWEGTICMFDDEPTVTTSSTPWFFSTVSMHRYKCHV